MHEYETIAHARALLKACHESQPSERTITGYKAKTQRLVKLAKEGGGLNIERLIACAKNTRSVSTWFSRRAALMYSLQVSIGTCLNQQDKAQRELKAGQVPLESDQANGWRATVASLKQFMEWHERLQREPAPSQGERDPRHSKRKDLRGLPSDWRERLVARMPKYRQAVLLAAVTGCRPEELVKGVRLSLEGGVLRAVIEGAKVTGKSGQPWRHLTWVEDSDAPLVAMLAQEVRNGLGFATIRNVKAFSGAVRAAGEREWPKRKAKLSAYCFRHQFAADMKAVGTSEDEISKALGHVAGGTKSRYGHWAQGSESSGVAPRTVEAVREVRTKVDRWAEWGEDADRPQKRMGAHPPTSI